MSKYNIIKTSVSDRIDALMVVDHGNKHLFSVRQEQSDWLKQTILKYWKLDLPQPFISFAIIDGYFVLSWLSDTECNTLTVYPENHTGQYEDWIKGRGILLSKNFDLDKKESWEWLEEALV